MMPLTKLFYESDLTIVTYFVVLFFVSGFIIFTLAFHPRMQKAMKSLIGINAGFYGPVTTMFTFTAAFSGAAVWGQFQKNVESINAEALAINGYYETLLATDLPAAPVLKRLAKEYVESALSVEWKELSSARISTETQGLFQEIERQTIAVANKAETGSVISGMLVRTLESWRTARATRLGFRFHAVEITRWYALIFFGILSQFVVAITHIEQGRRAPKAAALLIVSSLVLGVILTIALSVNPYEGLVRVPKAPIEALLSRM